MVINFPLAEKKNEYKIKKKKQKKHAVLLFSIISFSFSLAFHIHITYITIIHTIFTRGQPLLFEPSHFISDFFFKSVAFSSRIWIFFSPFTFNKNKFRNYIQSLFLNAKDVKWTKKKKCWPKEKLNKTANEKKRSTITKI